MAVRQWRRILSQDQGTVKYVDGNTAEMDVERAKFTENALMYEYEVDRVKGHYKDMEDLLKNTPY